MNLKLGLVAIGAALGLTACGSQGGAPPHISDKSFLNGIVGGEEVEKNDPIAHMTGLLYDTQQGAICTASILSKEWMLTAGHCVENANPKALVVIFGTDANSQSKEDQDQMQKNARRVASYQLNPRYTETMTKLEAMAKQAEAEGREITSEEIDAVTDWGDVALVKLESEIPAGYEPAKILDIKSQLHKGDVVTLAGYGITSGGPTGDGAGTLRKVDVSVAEAVWGSTEVLMDQTNKKGACHGDSGGPAYAQVNGELHLFGVTSRGIRDDQDTCTQFAAYTNIQNYRDWIKQVSGL